MSQVIFKSSSPKFETDVSPFSCSQNKLVDKSHSARNEFLFLQIMYCCFAFLFFSRYVMIFTLGNSQKFDQSAHFTSSCLGLSVALQQNCRIGTCLMVREALHLWLSVFFTGTKLLLFIMFDSFSCIFCV